MRSMPTLVLVLLLAACSSGADPRIAPDTGGADAMGPDPGAEDAVPGEVGEDVAPEIAHLDPFEPVLAQSLQSLLEEYLAFSGDPGVTMTIRTGDRLWWSGAAGVADRATGAPMEPSMGFRVGSNTKPYVATLVMMLWDEERVDLDASIADYLPEYPQWSEVTVRMLLGMRSGIHDYLTDMDFILGGLMDPDALDDPLLLVDFVADMPYDFPPGTQGAYCNTNYVLLGLLVERLTAQPFVEVLNARIIDPLGLAVTRLDETPEEDAGLAHGYMDLGIVAFVFGIPPAALGFIPGDWFMEGQLVDATYLFPPMTSWSAGSLISSSEDMVIFMRALLRGELVSDAALAEMKLEDDITLLGDQVPYGLGLQFRDTPYGMTWGHGGLNFGYQAGTRHFEELDLTFSDMHNYLPEQSYVLELEMLEWLINGLDESYAPCLPDEGMFTGEDGTVELRFKGPINPAAQAPPVGGLTKIQGRLDGELLPLYGLTTDAAYDTSGFSPRLVITSVSPSTTEGVDLRYTTVSLNPALLNGKDGTLELGVLGPYDVIVAVADLEWNAQWQKAEKMCFTAVFDGSRAAKMGLCGGPDFLVGDGAMLKLFASLPVTTDPAAIAAALQPLGLEPCTCLDPDQQPVPCE
jgi:D-alanyl-D-alanine carboxypeptidase